jgi:hypothetical protein
LATGNLYTTPRDITQCEQNGLKEKHPVVPDPCIKSDDHFESVLALDLENGTIIWSHHLGAYDTWNRYCFQPHNPNCPPIPGSDLDFGEAPLLHTILDDNVHPPSRQDVAIVGQNNGFLWALDHNDGHKVWATVNSIPYFISITCFLFFHDKTIFKSVDHATHIIVHIGEMKPPSKS